MYCLQSTTVLVKSEEGLHLFVDPKIRLDTIEFTEEPQKPPPVYASAAREMCSNVC